MHFSEKGFGKTNRLLSLNILRFEATIYLAVDVFFKGPMLYMAAQYQNQHQYANSCERSNADE
jgi:hypothetical protein